MHGARVRVLHVCGVSVCRHRAGALRECVSQPCSHDAWFADSGMQTQTAFGDLELGHISTESPGGESPRVRVRTLWRFSLRSSENTKTCGAALVHFNCVRARRHLASDAPVADHEHGTPDACCKK